MGGMNKQIRGSLSLLLASLIWGCAFVAQSVGMEQVGALTFHCVRFFLAALAMLAVILIKRRGRLDLSEMKPALKGGAVCGVALCAASLAQQYGILYTTVGKAGFITSIYMLAVPIYCLALGRRPEKKLWFCVAVALAGLYILSISGEDLRMSLGDSLVLLCALLFGVQILCVDHFAPKCDPLELNCVQLFMCSILTVPFMFFIDKPDWRQVGAAWLPIAYAGVMSGGAAYALQIVGQRDVKPALASMLMSLESVFAALGGWILLGQTMTAREILGSALMFGAVLFAQLPGKKNQKTA